MPSPVRLTEAMRTESSRVRTSASERSRTAGSIMGGVREWREAHSTTRAWVAGRTARYRVLSKTANQSEAAMRFEGKVVMVTGAGSGIGAGTARRFSAEGAIVVLVGRHRANIAAVAKELPKERTRIRVADVSRLAQVEAAIAATVKEFGRLDVMGNNAGVFAGSPVTG